MNLEGLSDREIADAMSLSLRAVRGRLQRARDAMREKVNGSAEQSASPSSLISERATPRGGGTPKMATPKEKRRHPKTQSARPQQIFMRNPRDRFIQPEFLPMKPNQRKTLLRRRSPLMTCWQRWSNSSISLRSRLVGNSKSRSFVKLRSACEARLEVCSLSAAPIRITSSISSTAWSERSVTTHSRGRTLPDCNKCE